MSGNEALGQLECIAGQADVYQTKRIGGHFYTRCECCGLQQGTKAARQQHIWDNTQFIEGVAYTRPSNVTESVKPVPLVGPPEEEKENVVVSQVTEDFDPSASQSSVESEADAAPGKTKKALWAVGITLASMAVGVWMS